MRGAAGLTGGLALGLLLVAAAGPDCCAGDATPLLAAALEAGDCVWALLPEAAEAGVGEVGPAVACAGAPPAGDEVCDAGTGEAGTLPAEGVLPTAGNAGP